MDNYVKLIVSILICELAGIAGSIFTAPAIPIWYAALKKPLFNPPSWVFTPVWTLLYFLMGIALYLVWKKSSQPGAKRSLFTFAFQLLLNIVWSMIFFGTKDIYLAFIVIMLLWVWIGLTILRFKKISKPAVYLLIPYYLWVSFASYLNYSLWQLNK